ncbi:MAG TPA: ABC transporter ATP-binding protein [Clostridium sp.]|nr:ABC transporter ATP-binding protein [Clostridium sp.]
MIRFENVSFNYDGKNYNGIKNINIEIKKGQFILLCGRIGCRKTTIIRIINKLIPHFYKGSVSGQVYIGDKELESIPMYNISEKVGSVFQNPRSQFFNVDTDSEIAFGLENLSYESKVINEKVNKSYRDLNIEKLRGKNIFNLSGGEKQKIAFASVYAMKPDIYVLDEPSSNLDIYAIDELKKNIMMLKYQGKTIIIAEHRLYYLKDIVDKILYMKEGRIDSVIEREEFLKIPNKLRENMGLRTLDLNGVIVGKKTINKEKAKFQIRDLSVGHDKLSILNNINLDVSCGEVISIIGHNGAGKSTFLRTICGLLKKCGGIIKWDGKEINQKDALKLTYMVMQDVNYQLFAESVEKECTLGIKNPDMKIVDETIKSLDIYQYKDRHPAALSGGQKQRVSVAVSMICNKKILIFDEPTSGLDFDSMKKVSNLIKRLSELGKIIFIVTHDYEFISLCCNRVVHLDNGQMLEDYYLDNSENIHKLKEFFIL